MEFRDTGRDEHPYELMFEVDEIEVVRAVFRELIFRLAQKGNPGSISEFDLSLADWDDESGPRSALITSYEDFAELFEDFYGNTNDAIVEIARESADPPFLNDYIILRHDLGERALKLAEEIRKGNDAALCRNRR